MTSQGIKNKRIPDMPGVYIFEDIIKRPIYIGRATSLKDRIKSYFAKDLNERRGRKIVEMVLRAKNIKWQETRSVLEAILIEAKLIGQYSPIYNTDLKDDKTGQLVIITREEYPRIFLMRQREYENMKKSGGLDFEAEEIIGPFGTGSNIKEVLSIIRSLFPFRDKKSSDKKTELFYQSIEMSPDISKSDIAHKYRQDMTRISLILRGRSDELIKRLKIEMSEYAKSLQFEKANEIKKLLFNLSHINDLSLVKKERSNIGSMRIEAYDISHTSGTHAIGTFVVYEGSELNKSQYRKFIMRKSKNDDLLNLSELLFRRFRHTEWRFPDLIVLDGNQLHIDVANKILKSLRLDIPCVAVLKDERHKAKKIISDGQNIGRLRDTILMLNAEAHRFSIAFHRKRRKIIL